MVLLKDIKEGMMELWRKTFHDSNSYIDLIFDYYFNEDYIAWHEENGKIVSALLGIPYSFGYGKAKLKGLYLLGLATDQKYRHRGLMSDLLKEINERAAKDFDFTFLIPASDLNADYYRRRGYFNSFFRLEERFTSIHDFENDFNVSLYGSDERISLLKKRLFQKLTSEIYVDSLEFKDKIIDFILQQEKKPGSSASLCHTREDLEATLKESLINDSKIFLCLDDDKNITGLAFVRKSDIRRIELPVVYFEDKCTYYALLKEIKKAFPDYSMSVFINSEYYASPAIIDEIYGAENPQGGQLETLFGILETQFDITKLMEPYGMVRLLRFDSIMEYIAETRKEANFKLYIRDLNQDSSGQKTILVVKNGKMVKETTSKEILDKSVLNLSVKEISELLLRKKDSHSLIMEAFGVPRLILEMKLIPRLR